MKKHLLVSLFLFFLINANAQEQKFDWAKSFGSAGNDYGTAVVTDTLGNVFVCGDFSGTVDFDPSAATYNLTSNGANDIFVQKLDSSGNFQWAQSFGGGNDDWANALTIDNVGNVIITGRFIGTVDFDSSPAVYNLPIGGTFILKLSTTGNFVWAKSIEGTGNDQGNDVTIDKLGNVYVTGDYPGTADFNPGPGVYNMVSVSFTPDIYVLKLLSNGSFVWALSFGDYSNDYGKGISIDPDNNVIVNGSFIGTIDFDPSSAVHNVSGLNWSMFILKLDPSGAFIWAKSIGGADNIWPASVRTDFSGNVFTTGDYKGTIDFDPGASVFNLVPNAYTDVFVQKLNTNGDFVWAKSFGGYNHDKGKSIALDMEGNVYGTGVYYGTVDFDPGTGISEITAVDDREIYIQKLDSLGNFVWAKSIGGVGGDGGNAIAVGSNGSVFTTGFFSGVVDFNTSTSVLDLTSNGSGDVFVHKLTVGAVDTSGNGGSPVTVLETQKLLNEVSVYPNPSTGIFTINLNGLENVQIEVYNTQGQLIFVKDGISDAEYPLKLNSTAGMYILVVSSNEGFQHFKLVKKDR